MLEWREGEARQRRESGVLEEGRRREEELAARLQAVLQDSQVRSLQSLLHCLLTFKT